ncbi:hypothetical protein GO730_00655 [Spirosoma sp. HMF3257]|nr:hypothetical protein [Spirosoma telluris]
MPADLLPILQSRLTFILLNNLYGTHKYPDLTTQELLDIDGMLCRHYGKDAHNFLLDGRQLSLLKRFLETERGLIIRSRLQVSGAYSNFDLWGLLTDLLVSAQRPTEVISLSFFGIE